MREMQLRTHPKMKWEGISNWPPTWAGSYSRGDVLPGEEEGVLTGVEMVEPDTTSACHLTLRREHRGSTSGALLHCDDEEVIPRLFEILKGCIGRPLSQISDLDVDL
jgi:hypothetical protein